METYVGLKPGMRVDIVGGPHEGKHGQIESYSTRAQQWLVWIDGDLVYIRDAHLRKAGT